MVQHILEGSPQELATYLAQHPDSRFRLVEISSDGEGPEEKEAPLPDPRNAASIALLRSWIAQAPTEPQAIREAEEDLRELKKNLNLPRKEAGARLHFPEVE